MPKQKQPSRKFSGMGYREVQYSNSIRRSQLPKTEQKWLKENGYKNVGWESVIQLYQKLNDLLDDSTLEELFLEADRIGQKYQTSEEVEAFHQQVAAEVSAIADLIDQQFPDTEVEVKDFSQSPRIRPRTKQTRRKYR
jgi:hypothetical protein